MEGVPYLCYRCRYAGLAAFSSVVGIDPWTKKEHEGGLLSAQLVGGTATYFSPEQSWLKAEMGKVKQHDEQAYTELKRNWVLTPATSDLFQAGKTVLEMHARPNKAMKGAWKSEPLKLLRQCMSRTPAVVLRDMSSVEAEAWVVEKLGLGQFKGRFEQSALAGEQLLAFPTMSLKGQNGLIEVREG